MNTPLSSQNKRGNDPVHVALRAAICVPTRRSLWTPADEIEFVPGLSDTLFGDGRALLGLTTIHSRPAFYVLRIDSRWEIGTDTNAPEDAVEFYEFIDDICFALEDEFGPAWHEENEDGEPDAWPSFNDRDGCLWWRMNWPDVPGVQLEPHPYSRHFRILPGAPS